jgi:hypothetical protein
MAASDIISYYTTHTCAHSHEIPMRTAYMLRSRHITNRESRTHKRNSTEPRTQRTQNPRIQEPKIQRSRSTSPLELGAHAGRVMTHLMALDYTYLWSTPGRILVPSPLNLGASSASPCYLQTLKLDTLIPNAKTSCSDICTDMS